MIAENITTDKLRDEVAPLVADGWRLVSITGVVIDDNNLELLYHFDKDLVLKHFRLPIAKTDSVPSITDLTFAAVLAENELQDFFGVKINGLPIDYNSHLYLEEEIQHAPLCRITVVKKKEE